MTRKASLTVEAAFALPFFFLCMTALVCTLHLYAVFSEKTVQLEKRAEKTASLLSGVYSAGGIDGGSRADSDGTDGGSGADRGGTGETDGIIDLPEIITFRPFALPSAIPGIRVRSRARVRAWIGYHAGEEAADDDGDPLVYVTDHESVYHTSSDCTHLLLSWEAVPSSSVAHLRSESRHRYHPCEKCVGQGGANSIVYISPQGETWHNLASCSGLTRHVHLVKQSETGGLRPCSRCGSEAS